MKLHEEPIWDADWRAMELARCETFKWLLMDFMYNYRLVMVRLPPHDVAYEYAWCYQKDTKVVMDALAQFDPDTQDEPIGWHKRPLHPSRKAPHRGKEPHYNRYRCPHGTYLDDMPCAKDPTCFKSHS